MHRGVVLIVVATLAVALAVPSGAYAEEQDLVFGHLVNGTAGGTVPAGAVVKLYIVDPSNQLHTLDTLTDDQGRFAFSASAVAEVVSPLGGETTEGFSAAIAAVYQGVEYGQAMSLPLLPEPLELAVYETTTDLSPLRADSAVLLVKRADESERTLSASEVISLVNDSDRTFVADTSPDNVSMMSFLRFSLPQGASELRVESDLSGGDIINVGSGFALTSSVPPGEHLLGFSYTFPYSGGTAEFTRSFHFDTGAFRVLVHESLGQVQIPDLATTAPVDLGEASYRVWEGGLLASGDKLSMEFSGLPQPPWYRRLGDTLFQGRYPKLAVLTLLGLVLAGVLVYGTFLARLRKVSSMSLAGPVENIDDGERR